MGPPSHPTGRASGCGPRRTTPEAREAGAARAVLGAPGNDGGPAWLAPSDSGTPGCAAGAHPLLARSGSRDAAPVAWPRGAEGRGQGHRRQETIDDEREAEDRRRRHPPGGGRRPPLHQDLAGRLPEPLRAGRRGSGRAGALRRPDRLRPARGGPASWSRSWRPPRGSPIVAVLGNHDFESGQAGRGPADPHRGRRRSCSTATPARSTASGSPGSRGSPAASAAGRSGPGARPAIKQFVQEAIDEALKLESALARLRTDRRRSRVLHYAPIRATVEGEPPRDLPVPRLQPAGGAAQPLPGRRPSSTATPTTAAPRAAPAAASRSTTCRCRCMRQDLPRSSAIPRDRTAVDADATRGPGREGKPTGVEVRLAKRAGKWSIWLSERPRSRGIRSPDPAWLYLPPEA